MSPINEKNIYKQPITSIIKALAIEEFLLDGHYEKVILSISSSILISNIDKKTVHDFVQHNENSNIFLYFGLIMLEHSGGIWGNF